MISVFKMPYQLEPVGNVIELRPNDRVSSVSDNGDGTYAFTLVYDTGVTHTRPSSSGTSPISCPPSPTAS